MYTHVHCVYTVPPVTATHSQLHIHVHVHLGGSQQLIEIGHLMLLVTGTYYVYDYR